MLHIAQLSKQVVLVAEKSRKGDPSTEFVQENHTLITKFDRGIGHIPVFPHIQGH